MQKKIRKAIIPAAGLGTRFLPATKAQPKEMLPILNKPTIQYIVEEAVASGIEDIIIVTGRGKRAIEDHFDNAFELEVTLQNNGKLHLLEEVQSSNKLADIHYIRQHEPRGLGHAIWCARKFIGNEPFAVLLGDDIVRSEGVPCLKQMIDIYERTESSVLAVQRVDWEDVSRYGIVKPKSADGFVHLVEQLVEKPKREEAPSNMAIIGRYILSPAIFRLLEVQESGAGGEIQLTDAIAVLNRLEQVFAYEFTGERYDVGEVNGFVKTTIEFALRDPKLRDDVLAYIKELLSNEEQSGIGALLKG